MFFLKTQADVKYMFLYNVVLGKGTMKMNESLLSKFFSMCNCFRVLFKIEEGKIQCLNSL